MIVCKVCGYHNDDEDAFCGNCRGYLAHVGEHVADVDAEVEDAPAEEQAEGGGLLQKVRQVVGLEGSGEVEAATGESEVADAAAEAEAQAQAAAQREREEARRERDAAEARAAAEAAERERGAAEARAAEQERAAAEAKLEAQRAEEAVQAQRRAEEEAREKADEHAAREQEDSEEEQRARREAAERARSEAEEEARRLEAERKAAEERARREAELREQADREAAEAQERARRAAALVATPPPPAPPAPAKPAPAKPPQRSGRRSTASPAAAGPEAPADSAQAIAARKPTEQRPAPPPRRGPVKKEAPSRPIEPGDLVCGQCGEPNKPDRKFCRRCASSLSEAEVAKTPLLKRIFGRKPKTVQAGERPGRGKGGAGKAKGARRKVSKVVRTVLRWGIALIILVGLVGALGPWREPVTDWVNERWQTAKRMVVPDYERVNPVGASATSHLPGHEPDQAIDGFDNTYWATPGGDGEVLTVAFGEPVDLDQIGFFSGAAGADFLRQPRPRELHLVFSDGSTANLELADDAEFQTLPIEARQVTEVEIHLLRTYPSSEGDAPAITLIRFFTRLR